MKSICKTDKFGNKYWYLNGKLHREDGPAYESINGYHGWYFHGKWVSCKDKQEFLRIVKLMAFS